MNAKHIESSFAAMGARLKVREVQREWRRWFVSERPEDYAVDIQKDRHDLFFELRVPTHLRDSLELTVMQSEPKQRHLLLAVRKSGDKPQLDRFLCGHDEREWFVAAVPGGASSVRQAMDALLPAPVRQALASQNVSTKKRYSRKNRAFRRQGEWFFVPEPNLVGNPKLVLHNEPLRRGAGKPHMVEELVRTGGEVVYVSTRGTGTLTEAQYKRFMQREPAAASQGWRVMRRNPTVYVRG